MADLIPPEQRQDAYSLLRMSNNLGISIGPAIGGFIATRSYTIAFYCRGGRDDHLQPADRISGRETLPSFPRADVPAQREKLGGYGRILRDRPFISFVAAFTLTQMCATLVWVLMAVYAKNNYGVPENLYGLIPTTNAVIVVLFQVSVTQISKKHPPLRVLALGSLFYAVGVGSVALGQGFWGFWLSMVVVTVGELILIPTSTTYAANLAPAEMRGRYMSVYGLTWGLATGIGPVVGGMLNDTLGPKAIWYGGFLVGLASMVSFLLPRSPRPPAGGGLGSVAGRLKAGRKLNFRRKTTILSLSRHPFQEEGLLNIGAVFPQTEFPADPAAVRDYIQTIEGLGYSHLMAYDHVLGANPDRPGGWRGTYTYQDSFLEPFVLFSFAAGITPNLAYMPGVPHPAAAPDGDRREAGGDAGCPLPGTLPVRGRAGLE